MLTSRQVDILLLLYRFRFLTRRHIQSILNHKHLNRVASWLQQLITDGYIIRDTNHKVPIYSLASKGRTYLKSKEGLSISRLNQVWRETKYSDSYRERCLKLGDVYLELLAKAKKENQTLHFYTKVELNARVELISPPPDSYIALEEKSGAIKRYFVEIFTSAPLRIIRQRIQQYIDYYDSGEWQNSTNKPFPTIVITNTKSRVIRNLNFQEDLIDRPGLKFYDMSDLETK